MGNLEYTNLEREVLTRNIFSRNRTLYELKLEERTENTIQSYLKENSLTISSLLEEKLKEVILISLNLNRDVNWIPMQNLDVVRTPEEFLDMMKLRSEVYEPLKGYKNEFPEEISGLLFDNYDKISVIFLYKRPKMISGSIRIILDSEIGLPSEEKIELSDLRKKGFIAEFSRQVIHKDFQAKGNEFRSFYAGAYNLAISNGIRSYIAGIDRNHLGLYEKFGGINIERELESYGAIEKPFLITSWNIENTSAFFHKAILRERGVYH